MAVHLVNQLRFARHEFERCFEGVSEEDAVKRVLPMNCISWMVGHLATHENAVWNLKAQGVIVQPGLYDLTGAGRPASTPPLADMKAAWREVTTRADVFLDTLSPADLDQYLQYEGKPAYENTGSVLQRVIYHYWFHIGEMHAVRQQLGHKDLPDFVGDMENEFAYRPDLLKSIK